MKTAHIEIQVFSDSIGSEWNDIDAAGAAYAEFLEERLTERLERSGFSTTDINVTYHANLAGYARNLASSDDYENDQELEMIVDQVTDTAWIEFCDDASSRDL